MAAVGGIMIGSNVAAVSVQNYAGNTLLLAVGAAVIGGTSLFGGKGRMIDALIGGAVVEVIQNGMSNLVQGNNGVVGAVHRHRHRAAARRRGRRTVAPTRGCDGAGVSASARPRAAAPRPHGRTRSAGTTSR